MHSKVRYKVVSKVRDDQADRGKKHLQASTYT